MPTKEYYQLHKAELKAQQQLYYQQHREQELSRLKQYRLAHKDERSAYIKQYRLDHKDKFKEYYQLHKSKIKARSHLYYQQHKDNELSRVNKYRLTHRAYWKEVNLLIKTEVITHYGNGKCACIRCGYDDIRALSIDHIDGNGAQHRRTIKVPSGNHFYRWLRKNNFPSGFQTLCMNCQWIKRVENGESNKLFAKETLPA